MISLDLYDDIPQEFICPISMEIMTDPVICQDGYTYEKLSIMKFQKSISPITRETIDKSKIIPNRALKETITKFIEGKQYKNPIIISNPSYKYGNYLFDIKNKENEMIIKIQNKDTYRMYEGIITEKDIYIKPFTEFNIMLINALTYKKNYNININEIKDEYDKTYNIIVKILYYNDIINKEELFRLNEIYKCENEKQKYNIMDIKNEIKKLKLNIIKLKQDNETILLMSKSIIVMNTKTGKNENIIIEYKYPKNLEYFDYCKFMQDADIRTIAGYDIILNNGSLLYHNKLTEFTNLKKLKIPNINMIQCNNYTSNLINNILNFFPKLQELIVQLYDHSGNIKVDIS